MSSLANRQYHTHRSLVHQSEQTDEWVDKYRAGRQGLGTTKTWTFLCDPVEATQEFTGKNYVFALERSVQ